MSDFNTTENPTVQAPSEHESATSQEVLAQAYDIDDDLVFDSELATMQVSISAF